MKNTWLMSSPSSAVATAPAEVRSTTIGVQPGTSGVRPRDSPDTTHPVDSNRSLKALPITPLAPTISALFIKARFLQIKQYLNGETFVGATLPDHMSVLAHTYGVTSTQQ